MCLLWPMISWRPHGVVPHAQRSVGHERYTKRKLKLFLAARLLEFVKMGILGPFPKWTRRHCFMLVITDRFSKMTRAIPLRSRTATDVAITLLVNCIYP